MRTNTIVHIDALSGFKMLPDQSVDCIVSSPPYWNLRDYKVKGQIGLEDSFTEYLDKLSAVFSQAHRVLKTHGTLWVNIADTYFTNKVNSRHKSSVLPKSFTGIPQRFAINMVDSGWLLRNTIIWRKPNAMPESAKDRFTNDFEYLYFFTKSSKYYFNQQFEAFQSNQYDLQRMKDGRKEYDDKYSGSGIKPKIIRQRKPFGEGLNKGRNKRAVWDISTKAYKDAHFAVFPEDLIEIPIKAGCPPKGLVLDPFIGSGTTAVVAKRLKRQFLGFEINPQFIELANNRLRKAENMKLKENDPKDESDTKLRSANQSRSKKLSQLKSNQKIP